MKRNHVNFITASITITCIVTIVCFSVVTSSYHKKIDRTQKQITETVTKDLEKYFGSYMSDSSYDVQTLQKTVGDLQEQITGEYLTEEQLKTLTDSVVTEITPDVIKNLTSKNDELSQQTISSLEEQINTRIREVIEQNNGTDRELSEEDKNALTDSISLIVEANILATVKQNQASTDGSIRALEDSITAKISKLNQAVATYEKKISEMEAKLKVLQEEGANAEEINNMTTSLTELKNKFDTFNLNSSNTTQIIETKIGEETQRLNDAIGDLQTSLSNWSTKVSREIDGLQLDLKNNIDQLTEATATKSELEAQKKNLDDAIKATQELAESKSKEETAAAEARLNASITALGDNASAELIAAKNALNQSISANKTNLTDEISAVNSALQTNSEAVDNKIADVKAEIEGLSNTITIIQTDIGNLGTRLTSVQSELQNNLDELTAQTATKEALTAQKTLLEQAISDAQTAAGTKSEDDVKKAKESLQAAIDSLGTETSATKTALENAQSALETSIQNNYDGLDKAIGDVNTSLTNAQIDIDGKIGEVNEKISGLNNTITSIQSAITSIQKDISDNSTDISALKQSTTDNSVAIASAKTDIQTAQSNISQAQTDISKANENITALEGENDTLNKSLSTVSGSLETFKGKSADDLAALDTELTNALSEAKTALEGSISGVSSTTATNLSKLNTDLTAMINNNQATATEKYELLNTVKTSLENTISANQTSISDLQGKITANETAISTNKGKIATAEQNIKDMNNTITQKANKTDLDALSTTVSGKADQSYVDSKVSGLANGSKTTYTWSDDRSLTITVPAS